MVNLAGTHGVFEAAGLAHVVADLEGLRRATQICGLDSAQRIYAERMMEAYAPMAKLAERIMEVSKLHENISEMMRGALLANPPFTRLQEVSKEASLGSLRSVLGPTLRKTDVLVAAQFTGIIGSAAAEVAANLRPMDLSFLTESFVAAYGAASREDDTSEAVLASAATRDWPLQLICFWTLTVLVMTATVGAILEYDENAALTPVLGLLLAEFVAAWALARDLGFAPRRRE